MLKLKQIIISGTLLTLSGLVQAHGTHAIEQAAPVSNGEHLFLHLGEWALIIIAGLLISRFAIRILKSRLD